MKQLSYYFYPLVLFNSINQIDAVDFIENSSLFKVNRNGREICLDTKSFPNHKSATAARQSSSNNIFSTITGNEVVRVYGGNGCTGKSLSFSLNHEESNCNYCWDSCFKQFDDGSEALSNIKSINVPEGVVAVVFNTCRGSFGYDDPGLTGVLQPGCYNFSNSDDIASLSFATESTTTPGTYVVLGQESSNPKGNFESEMDVTHWIYGPGGIKNAQGSSWYQYIFELLDPTQPRMQFQVGIGGTWFTPSQTKWQRGDPCLCDPRYWPTDEGAEACQKPDLTKCDNGCCGTDGCEGLFQTMEGGSGYWLGKLPTSRVKWTIGSTTKCYTYWSNSPLEVTNSQDLECDSLGVIAVSNRLLYPPDGIGFIDDGMFGQAWINTPIGKLKRSDKKRALTLIVDTKNFKGPIAYMLPDYYDVQGKWKDQNGDSHPIQNFSNTGMNTGTAAFEWSTVPVYGHQSDSSRDFRMPKMQFSFNEEGKKTTMMSAGKSWKLKSDLFKPLDQTMNSKKPTLDESKLLRNERGVIHACEGLDTELTISFEDQVVSIGAHAKHRTEADDMCTGVIDWDETNPSLNCNATHCKVKDSYTMVKETVTQKNNDEWVFKEASVEAHDTTPSELQGNDVFPPHDFSLNYDRRAPVNLCGAKPSKKTLYCRQTSSEDWIAWRWYWFHDQPGFRRLNLNTKQKTFLKRRIKRLHRAMQKNSPLNEWLTTPSSMNKLVTIDPKLIIDPPAKKFKYGHVPIVVYQGMEKPNPCVEV